MGLGSPAGRGVSDHERETSRLREFSDGADHAEGTRVDEVVAGEHAARHQLRIVCLLCGARHAGHGLRLRLRLGLGLRLRLGLGLRLRLRLRLGLRLRLRLRVRVGLSKGPRGWSAGSPACPAR